MIRRSSLIYALLVAAWVAIVGWQVLEHSRVKRAARDALVYRARDITTTLGVLVRSQRRLVSQERLESALKELVKTGELKSVALLNVAGDIVASAGARLDLETKDIPQRVERWDDHTVTLVNPVDLGTNLVQEGESRRPIIVMPRHDPAAGTNADRRGAPPFGWWRTNPRGTNATNSPDPSPPEGAPAGPRRDPSGRPLFGRPPWMSEEEFKSLIQKQGLHSFVVVISNQSIRAASTQDLWLRSIIGILGGVAASGLALAWRNVVKSSDLQIRLLRASELNNHLKEMNIAAAGLAHETRNPLNIIRGLAQMISKQDDASAEISKKSRAIIDETDRVAAQLNEFINYSRPREIRRAPVSIGPVVEEVVRALSYDIEEKNISLQVSSEPLSIEADEQLLRQSLFNLLLNAIQAVDQKGEVSIQARKCNGSEAVLEVCDNGVGVSPEHSREIFKPYFTTHEKGTGLGLAVVKQIVLAHGWEIECLPNDPRGAILRITHLKLAPRN